MTKLHPSLPPHLQSSHPARSVTSAKRTVIRHWQYIQSVPKRKRTAANAVDSPRSVISDSLPALGQRDIELLLMNGRIALDRHDPTKIGLDLGQDVAFRTAQRLGHLRIDPKNNLIVAVDTL